MTTTGSLQPSIANDIIVHAITDAQAVGETYTIDNSLAIPLQAGPVSGNALGIGMAWKILPGTSTIQPTWTISVSSGGPAAMGVLIGSV